MRPYKAFRAKVCSGFARTTGEKQKTEARGAKRQDRRALQAEHALRANGAVPMLVGDDGVFPNFFRDLVLTG